MKHFIIVLMLLCASAVVYAKTPRIKAKPEKIEIVNEKTVIFKNIVRLEIKTTHNDQITYVYSLDRSELIKVARGTFEVDLSMGNYLIQSDGKITNAKYEIMAE